MKKYYWALLMLFFIGNVIFYFIKMNTFPGFESQTAVHKIHGHEGYSSIPANYQDSRNYR